MKLYKQFTLNFSNHNLKEKELKGDQLQKGEYELNEIIDSNNNMYSIGVNSTKRQLSTLLYNIFGIYALGYIVYSILNESSKYSIWISYNIHIIFDNEKGELNVLKQFNIYYFL